jgi:DNA-binding protein H-NS
LTRLSASHYAGDLYGFVEAKLSRINDLKAQIGAEMKNREKSEMEKTRSDINAIAQSLGLSLKDLLDASESKGKVRRQTRKVDLQYRNPQDASQEWTGRGRQPGWVKNLLASRKNLMSAKVNS